MEKKDKDIQELSWFKIQKGMHLDIQGDRNFPKTTVVINKLVNHS